MKTHLPLSSCPPVSGRARTLLFCSLILPLAILSGCLRSPGPPMGRVVVLDFRTSFQSPELDYLSEALAQKLSIQLIQLSPDLNNDGYPDLTVVDRRLVEEAEIKRWWDYLFFYENRYQRLGRKLKADYLISGSASQFGNNFTVQAELNSLSTGEPVPMGVKTNSCDRIEDLVPCVSSLAVFMAEQVSQRTLLKADIAAGRTPGQFNRGAGTDF